MNKKKLSHSGSLQSSVTSVLAALLCILIGLLVGFLVLVAINPAHAWGDGFVRIIKGGFHDAPYGVGKELANAPQGISNPREATALIRPSSGSRTSALTTPRPVIGKGFAYSSEEGPGSVPSSV